MIIWCMQPDGNKRRGAMQKSKYMETTAERKRQMKCSENGERNLVSCAFIYLVL